MIKSEMYDDTAADDNYAAYEEPEKPRYINHTFSTSGTPQNRPTMDLPGK